MASNNDHLLLRILWGGTMGGLSTGAQFCIPCCQKGSWPNLGMRKGLSPVWGLGRAGGWGPSSCSTQLLPPLGFSSPGTLLMWPLLQQETGLFYLMAHFPEGNMKAARFPMAYAHNQQQQFLLPDFLLCEENKPLHVWTVPMGYFVLWLNNSFWLQH